MTIRNVTDSVDSNGLAELFIPGPKLRTPIRSERQGVKARLINSVVFFYFLSVIICIVSGLIFRYSIETVSVILWFGITAFTEGFGLIPASILWWAAVHWTFVPFLAMTLMLGIGIPSFILLFCLLADWILNRRTSQ